MKRILFIIPIIITGLILFFILQSINTFSGKPANVNGVSLVGTPNSIEKEKLIPIKEISANWIAVIPYGFSYKEKPELRFEYKRQWWGEKPPGVKMLIKYAKYYDLKVMVKPHVWIIHEGWPGDYNLASEEDWQKWENDYSDYILTYARIADSMEVEMLCIGTEFRIPAVERPRFWINLIKKVRKNYGGKITYAANWDNFEKITFWKHLDYIGVNAYFPLSNSKTPETSELISQWETYEKQLYRIHRKYELPVIFTEYGYRSIDYGAGGHWNLENDTLMPNLEVQKNAYEALFNRFWYKKWFSGGFLWKWYPQHDDHGGPLDHHFTPQNKPVEEVIRHWYGKNQLTQ